MVVIDDRRPPFHRDGMRGLLKVVSFASMTLALACSNGQPSRSNDNRDDAPAATINVPAVALTGRVTDAADILTAQQEATLTTKLEQLEKATGHQVVVATVPTLGGADVATFTRNLANNWRIGRQGYDDGVVILVAPNERKVRIAVGHGLEKTLTHDVCKEIIDKQMLPRFLEGDLPGGIEAGANAIIARLS